MSAISGYMSSKQAKKAAEAQAQASKEAAEIQLKGTMAALEQQQKMYDQSRSDMAPFMKAARDRLPALQQGLDEYNQYMGEYSDMMRQGGPDYMSAVDDYGKVISEGPGEYKGSEYESYMLAQLKKNLDNSVSAGTMASGDYQQQFMRNASPIIAGERRNWLNEWAMTKLNPGQSLMSAKIGAMGQGFSDKQGMLGNLVNMAGTKGQVGQVPMSNTVGQMASNSLSASGMMGNTMMAGSNAMAGGVMGAGNAQAMGNMGTANSIQNASAGAQNAIAAYMMWKGG